MEWTALKTANRTILVGLIFTGAVLAIPTFLSAQVRIDQILSQRRVSPDVVVDTPTPEDFSKCTSRPFKEEDFEGQCVYAPDGTTPLRVICKKVGGKDDTVQQIRYFRNGIEVYRDDLIGRESRWLGDAGSRIGVWGAGSPISIVSWKSISPEEASSEAVAAISTGDEARYRRVALSKEDLAGLKITGPIAEELVREVDSLAGFKDLVTRLQIPSSVEWGAFNGNHPAMVPQGRYGLGVDLPVYFNAAVALINRSDESQGHQLYIGDMVKIGDAWKIVGLLSGEPFGTKSDSITVASTFFPVTGDGTAPGAVGVGGDFADWDKQIKQALDDVERVSGAEAPAAVEKVFALYMALSEKAPAERETWIRTAVQFLMAEIQKGTDPSGTTRLTQLFDQLVQEKASRDLIAFVRFRQLMADYYATVGRSELKDSERMKADEEIEEKLVAFAEEYARTSAAAEAMMFLALNREYVQDNDVAINYYTVAARDMPQSPLGMKAAGAARRLSGVGQRFALPGPWKCADGSPAEIPAGKKTVLFCWATWSLDAGDIASLKQILATHPNLNVLAIALDGEPETAQQGLQTIGQVPWKTVFVPASNPGENPESPTAIELGIQTAPMMLIVGEDGTLLFPNILTMPDLLAKLDSGTPR